MNSIGKSLVLLLCLGNAIARNNRITLLIFHFIKVCWTFQSIGSAAFLDGEDGASHLKSAWTLTDKVNFWILKKWLKSGNGFMLAAITDEA